MEFIFFSSRSRHTRYWRDWSSGVCSSDLTLSDFNIEDEALGTKTAQSGPKNRHTDPCNRIERPEPNSNTHGQPICAQGAKRRQWTDRKSTRLNSSHANISYAVFCLKKNKHTLRRSLQNA